jgi:hypothetical protein
LAGIATTATLAPGATVGTSNLLVAIAPSHTYSATLEADNFGNRYTGEGRFGGSFAAANLAGRGDLFSVRGLVSQDTGIWYGRAGYQIPVFATASGPAPRIRIRTIRLAKTSTRSMPMAVDSYTLFSISAHPIGAQFDARCRSTISISKIPSMRRT